MKKIKVSEASGPVLDWLVAKSEGKDPRHQWLWATGCFVGSPPCPYRPSTNWFQGGPIKEREGIATQVVHLVAWAEIEVLAAPAGNPTLPENPT